MKKVAIPVCNGHLCEYFGKCTYYEIVEVDRKILKSKQVELPPDTSVLDLPGWLEKHGVTDVIAYKVDKQIISLFASKKVNLFVGIELQEPKKIMDDYLNGKLESNKKIVQELMHNDN